MQRVETVTVLFTDMVGSTALARSVGAANGEKLRQEHLDVLRRAVEQNRGEVTKTLGDGIMAVFRSVGAATQCAREMQQAVELQARPLGDHAPALRVGISIGDVTHSADDWNGIPVVEAARLCDAAGRNQILVSEMVRNLATDRHGFSAVEPLTLKGFAEPVAAYELAWDPLGGPARLRVVVADDSVLLREGLVLVLQEAGFEVLGQAGDAEELLVLVKECEPDVVVVDVRMPPTHTTEGLQAAESIKQHHPGVGILVLSEHLETSYAAKLFGSEAPGMGYLLKHRVSQLNEFADAVRRVGAGASVLDEDLVRSLVGKPRTDDALSELTERESEVLALMAQGRSNQAIAQQLVVTPKTVEAHVRSILMKLGLDPTPDDHRRVLAVLRYLRD